MTREEAIYRLKNTAWLGTNADIEEIDAETFREILGEEE